MLSLFLLVGLLEERGSEMRIVLGSGRDRRTFDVPRDKVAREQAAEDLKVLTCRRGMLGKHRFFQLNGATA